MFSTTQYDDSTWHSHNYKPASSTSIDFLGFKRCLSEKANIIKSIADSKTYPLIAGLLHFLFLMRDLLWYYESLMKRLLFVERNVSVSAKF